jgi:hypothetical protein
MADAETASSFNPALASIKASISLIHISLALPFQWNCCFAVQRLTSSQPFAAYKTSFDVPPLLIYS